MSAPKYHFTEKEILGEYQEIERAKKDPLLFEVLYNRYHEPIYRFIYQRLNDKDLVSDITSHVFLKAMLNLEKYEFRGVPFASWLYRIANNELNQVFKRNAHLRTLNIEKEIAEEAEESFFNEYQPEVIQQISLLPESDLQLIEMRFFQGLSFKQMSEILATKEGNVKMRLYRILEKIKEKILNRKKKS